MSNVCLHISCDDIIINILKIRKLKSVGGGGRSTIAVEAIAVEVIAVHPGGGGGSINDCC